MDVKGSYPNVFQIWYGADDNVPHHYGVFINHNAPIFSKIPTYRFLKTSWIKAFLKKNGYSLAKFSCAHYRFQSDIIRFLVLYHFGGLYLDLDVKLNGRFGEFLALLVDEYSNRDLMLENLRIYFLWFKRGSKNLEKIIEHYMNMEFIDYDYNVFSLGGLLEQLDVELLPVNVLNKYVKHFVISG